MDDETAALLTARGNTHGDYSRNAVIAQSIKWAMRQGKWSDLSPSQAESLDLMATKMARVVTGNPYHIDHWRDIAGYAQLIVQELTPRKVTTHDDIQRTAPTLA